MSRTSSTLEGFDRVRIRGFRSAEHAKQMGVVGIWLGGERSAQPGRVRTRTNGRRNGVAVLESSVANRWVGSPEVTSPELSGGAHNLKQVRPVAGAARRREAVRGPCGGNQMCVLRKCVNVAREVWMLSLSLLHLDAARANKHPPD